MLLLGRLEFSKRRRGFLLFRLCGRSLFPASKAGGGLFSVLFEAALAERERERERERDSAYEGLEHSCVGALGPQALQLISRV